MNVHNFWGYISNTLNKGDLLVWMFLSGWFFPDVLHVRVDSPNQACWSPCTSIARPKSASFTAAPLLLLASSRFSGWKKAKIGFPVKGWRWTRFCKKSIKEQHQQKVLSFYVMRIVSTGAWLFINYCQKYFLLTSCHRICFSTSFSN